MKKLLFFLTGLALIWHTFYVHNYPEFLAQPDRVSFVMLSKVFQGSARAIVLFILILFFVGMPSAHASDSRPRPRNWLWTLVFWSVLLPLGAGVLYVNPHGMFPWENVKSSIVSFPYITTQSRTAKLAFYNQLENAPDILLIGSSRAIGIPPARILENTGHTAFNLAVNGGGPADYITFGRFAFSKPETPKVLIVEFGYTNLNPPETPIPVSMLPYMDMGLRVKTVDNALHDVLSFQSLSDSVYQLTYEIRFKRIPVETYQEDGMAIRRDVTEEQYKAGVEAVGKIINETYGCDRLYGPGVQQLNRLVALAAENKTAIVFYRSPVNDAYLEMEGSDNPDHLLCQSLLVEYASSLAASYPHVFFRDLTFYEPVGSLREKGFYDAHHLRPIAAQLVVDALTPDIQKALQWALSQRNQTP